MEIIFDTNSTDTFQDNIYPIIELNTNKDIKISQIHQEINNIISQNSKNRIIIIKPTAENNNMHLYAALLGINQSNDFSFPSCAIIKVKNHQQTMKEHEPYMFFTTAATYAQRLSQMSSSEMYKDISGLGYLGLDIKIDYLQNIITIRHQSNGERYLFKSSNKHNSIVLASLIKILSLMKIKPSMDVTVQIVKNEDETPINFQRLLNKLLWCCKLLFNSKNFK